MSRFPGSQLARRTVSNATNGFNVNGPIAEYVRRRAGGIPGDGGLLTRPDTLWHRRDVTPAGDRSILFFNQNRAVGVTNLDQPNTLPANQAFLIDSIRFSFLPGISVGGVRGSTSATAITNLYQSALNYGAVPTSATDTLKQLWQWHEKIREFLSQGEVKLKINSDRDIFTRYGLNAFPDGRGLMSNGSLSAAGTTTANTLVIDGISSFSNGFPLAENRFKFKKPWPLMGGQQFSMEVNFNSLVDFTETNLGPLNGASATSAGVLMCELEGEKVSLSNG